MAGVTGWKENNRTTCGLVVESADQMEHVGDWRSSLRFEGSPEVGKTSQKILRSLFKRNTLKLLCHRRILKGIQA